MKKKTMLLIVGVILVIFLLILGINYFFNSKPVPYYPKDLSENMLITNQTLIDLIVNNMTSPLGNNLTKDSSFEYGGKTYYYVCTENEHMGWIYYSLEPSSIKPGLYGPYDWCYV